MPFTPTLPESPSAEQVRSQLLAAGEYLSGLVRTAPDARGDGYKADVASARDAIHVLDPILSAMERGVPRPAGNGPTAATAQINPEQRSLGALVTSDGQYEQARGSFGSRHVDISVRGSVFNHNEAYRALIDSGENNTGGAGALIPTGNPTLPVPRQRRMFLRDMLTVQETGLTAIPYIREFDPEGDALSASTVAEGGQKPEVRMRWEEDTANVRKIAAWVPVTTEIIDDVPTLMGYINGRLAYMLAVREEQQFLNGPGTGSTVKGILTYAGVQTQAFVAGDPMATLGRAIGKVEVVDGDADGIAIHPETFWTMVTTRYASQFDGNGGAGLPYGQAPTNPWGLPVVRTRAVATGEAIVASWRMGAIIFDRMETTIRVGNQHSDFFTTNRVAVLAEERVAVAVPRPDFFVRAALQ